MIQLNSRCATPDGAGVVVKKEQFGNGDTDYRVGVKHDAYPAHRIPGLYKDDVLYYFPREVSAPNATS